MNYGSLVRMQYELDGRTSDEQVIREICRRITRWHRGESELASYKYVGSFRFPKVDDVSDGEIAIARLALCNLYQLPATGADADIITSIGQVGYEVIDHMEHHGGMAKAATPIAA